MASFQQERASLGKAHVGAMAEVAAECDALRRLVKLKSRELKSIRRLAHEVLLQRSDVECFLLSSLHQVGDLGLSRICGSPPCTIRDLAECRLCFLVVRTENVCPKRRLKLDSKLLGHT